MREWSPSFSTDFQGRPLAKAADMSKGERAQLKARRDEERSVRAKAWYWFNSKQLQARSPGHLERMLGLPEEARTLENQCAGKHCPSRPLVAKLEAIAPGGRRVLTCGPGNLFHALFGTADHCWRVATVLDEDGRDEWVGRSVGLEESVTRLCRLVAEECEAGVAPHVARLAQLAALLHLQAESRYEVFPWHTEGTFELFSAGLDAGSPVACLLDHLHIRAQVVAWARAKQLQRIQTDHNLRIGFGACGPADMAGAIARHLDDPLAFAFGFEPLRDRHPYLALMPETLRRAGVLLPAS